MAVHNTRCLRTALSLTALGLLATPLSARAQDNPPLDSNAGGSSANDPTAFKKIDLDLESTNLFYALKLLFSQVKANFTIDESLKALTVTAHLSQVPFRVALDTLLKSTGTPLTYKAENGIYTVIPKVEDSTDRTAPEIDNTPLSPIGGGTVVVKIPSTSLVYNAIDIVSALGGKVITFENNNSGQFGNGMLGGGQGGLGGGLGSSGFGGGTGGFGSSSSSFGGGLGGFGSSGSGLGRGSSGGRGGF